jgi:hypothetical protein
LAWTRERTVDQSALSTLFARYQQPLRQRLRWIVNTSEANIEDACSGGVLHEAQQLMRVVATVGVIGIGVAIAVITGSQHSKGLVIGLVVSIVTVVLTGMLWFSRRL